MINTLHIKNIGIIDDITIDFNKGLNVLTGTTGAGKSLIIDSLKIITGDRFSKDMIRKDETNSFVEMSLYIPELYKENDGNVIVSREINLNGKNLCKINGRMCTVNELKEFMSNVIDVHAQGDNTSLLNKKYHTKYLDKFIGEKLLNIKEKYIKLYEEYENLNKRLKENFGDEKEKRRELDLYKYELSEIVNSNLKENEEDELEEKRRLYMNYEKVSKSMQEIDNNLNNGAVDLISNSIRALEKIENVNEEYSKKLQELKNIYYDVQEIARDISYMNDDLEFDSEEQNEVEKRLDLILSLKRKYGNSVKEILEFSKELENKIYLIENSEEENNKIIQRISELENEMNILCDEMFNIREKNRVVLNDKINNELSDLEMLNCEFNAKQVLDDHFTKFGKSHIEFMIKTNIGNDEKHLDEIVSGGEMSRIMLAIKTVLSEVDEVPVLVFDEIDTGISGKACQSVGTKLRKISSKHQVLIVTHQAQIAAKGETNFYIYKEVINDKTITRIKVLNEEETINEIAKISSGDISETSIMYAKSLRYEVA